MSEQRESESEKLAINLLLLLEIKDRFTLEFFSHNKYIRIYRESDVTRESYRSMGRTNDTVYSSAIHRQLCTIETTGTLSLILSLHTTEHVMCVWWVLE